MVMKLQGKKREEEEEEGFVWGDEIDVGDLLCFYNMGVYNAASQTCRRWFRQNSPKRRDCGCKARL